VVLVDEIENGLYYKTMTKVWNTLFNFAEVNNTQLFASTHSLESLKALLPVLKGNEDKFSLIRTRYEDGVTTAKQIEGKYFESALEEGLEVR
jgi:AAA15 family ATPase/GTPase